MESTGSTGPTSSAKSEFIDSLEPIVCAGFILFDLAWLAEQPGGHFEFTLREGALLGN